MAAKKSRKESSKTKKSGVGFKRTSALLIGGVLGFFAGTSQEFVQKHVGMPSHSSSIYSVSAPAGCPKQDSIRVRESYVVSYDARTRNPYWVYEYITQDNLSGESSRENSKFREDPTIPEQHRSTLRDYRGSGYDRGHLAPAADHRHSQQAMDETFYLSNMSPQVGKGFNRGYWRLLEERIRKVAKENIGVHVVTGTLFLPKGEKNGERYVQYPVIGPNDVAVPTHYFKAILVESSDGTAVSSGWVLPNEEIANNTPLQRFEKSIEEIERLSGLVLFPSDAAEPLERVAQR